MKRKNGAIATFGAGIVLATTTCATRVEATDAFEIQVYDAEINAPLQPGLEVHTNYTFAGRDVPAYDGEVVPDRALRLTLEPALGITEWLELGAYLQSMWSFASEGSGPRFGGVKLRAKMVVPRRFELPVFLGLNVEIARIPHPLEENVWSNELRPIVGWTNGWLLLDVNPILSWGLSGPHAFAPELEPAAKVAINTQQGFALGIEHYSGLGLFSEGFSPLRRQDHLLFVIFDLVRPAGAPEDPSAWEVNAGLGHALTKETPQQWIIKTIVGHAL
jgi:hypothetical protein